jgi:hypothetical protein
LTGITSKNYRSVMTKVENLATLFRMDKSGVVDLLGEINGGKFYEFVHRDPRVEQDSTTA